MAGGGSWRWVVKSSILACKRKNIGAIMDQQQPDIQTELRQNPFNLSPASRLEDALAVLADKAAFGKPWGEYLAATQSRFNQEANQ